MYITKENVAQLKEFRSLPEFGFLLNFVCKEKILVRKPELHVAWEHKTFEKLYWRPSDRDVFLMPREKKVPSDSVIHHGFHYLLNKRYPTRLRRTPQLSLLMESLASSLDFYFASLYFKMNGKKHPFTHMYIERCHKSSKLNRSEFIRALNVNTEEAFKLYKTLTLEMYDFCQMLLSYCSQDIIEKKSVDELNLKLSRLRFRKFYKQFDFATFLLYVLGFCTSQSSKKDLEMVRDLKLRLIKSTSMMHFLELLEKS